jgi:hypothetical protein
MEAQQSDDASEWQTKGGSAVSDCDILSTQSYSSHLSVRRIPYPQQLHPYFGTSPVFPSESSGSIPSRQPHRYHSELVTRTRPARDGAYLQAFLPPPFREFTREEALQFSQLPTNNQGEVQTSFEDHTPGPEWNVGQLFLGVQGDPIQPIINPQDFTNSEPSESNQFAEIQLSIGLRGDLNTQEQRNMPYYQQPERGYPFASSNIEGNAFAVPSLATDSSHGLAESEEVDTAHDQLQNASSRRSGRSASGSQNRITCPTCGDDFARSSYR